MKLFYSPASPFARKVHATLIELGLQDSVELLLTPVLPGKPIEDYVRSQNPLGKIPALQLDTGETLFDSTIICEYLISTGPSATLLPSAGVERYATLTRQALAHGICESAVTIRYETFLRPEERQWETWIDDQWGKVERALDWFETHQVRWQGDVDLAQITLGCALGYLDFRAPDHDWRTNHPALTEWFTTFEQRPSMQGTRPHA
ncbi:glutathione S-transferase [Granulosicoccus sp. 3-233]|uniref:glutathione S-transferase n=1 Tax=Granulosicoccus sp. 3-233 TaxID=3417969 RepID=UPI003D336BCE